MDDEVAVGRRGGACRGRRAWGRDGLGRDGDQRPDGDGHVVGVDMLFAFELQLRHRGNDTTHRGRAPTGGCRGGPHPRPLSQRERGAEQGAAWIPAFAGR